MSTTAANHVAREAVLPADIPLGLAHLPGTQPSARCAEAVSNSHRNVTFLDWLVSPGICRGSDVRAGSHRCQNLA